MRSILRGNHGPLSSLSKLADGIRANTDMNRAASLSGGPNLGSKMNAAPWSNTWPAPGATLDLDFANDRGFVRGVGQGKSLDRVTFTRASNAQYVDNTGTLQTAANNIARFDWASITQTGAGTPASPYIIPLQPAASCNGLLIEESRTNRALWCRDATQASWVNTNITAALNQTGIDGAANSASSLTASAANGTTIQTVTLASGARASSIYLKRLSGSGAVQVSMDGTTWSTVDLSNGLWNRIILSATVTNPTVGIKIATNGDSVAMDFAQIEDGAFATSPVMTTSATVTRSADVASMSGVNLNNWYTNQSPYTFNIRYIPLGSGNTVFAFYTANVTQVQMYGNIFSVAVGSSSYINITIPNAYTANYEHNVGYSITFNNIIIKQSDSTIYTKSYVPGIPNCTIFYIGSTGNSTATSCVKRVTYFPKYNNSENALGNITGQAT